MISTNKLMIGNIILFEGKQATIMRLGDEKEYPITILVYSEYFGFNIFKSVEEEKVNPIPINEMILEEYGFVKEEDSVIEGEYDYVLNIENYYVTVNNTCSNSPNKSWSIHIDNDHFSTIGGGDLEYLHELQNILNIFCNIELKKKEEENEV